MFFIYTTSNCAACNSVKEFCRQNKVPFETRKMADFPEEVVQIMKKTGMRTAPIIKEGATDRLYSAKEFMIEIYSR